MPEQKVSLSEKLESIKDSIQQLPTAAATLNSASDDLAKSINDLDAVLKKFSLGVPAWVVFGDYAEDPYYDLEEVGYAKIGGKWGIAIRTRKGDLDPRSREDKEQWSFNDAPRYLRVRGVEKLPDLVQRLVAKSAEMAQSISAGANDVRELTSFVGSQLLEPPLKPIGPEGKIQRVPLRPRPLRTEAIGELIADAVKTKEGK
jgi:hypothetical protein